MNQDQYTELISRHGDDLFNYASYMLKNREDAADVVQEVFLKCWQNRERIEPEKGFNWLLRVACRRCLDLLRRRHRGFRRFLSLESSQLEQLPDRRQNPEADFQRREQGRQLERALSTLPPREQSILLLYYFQELDYAEIAVVMEMKTGAVRTSAHRSRRRLSRLLNDAGS